LLIKNSNEHNSFQFHSTSIAIQKKSNEDSFSKLNKIFRNKISKGKKNMKRENNHSKNHPHLGKKLNCQNLTQM
jgi:hypothetical protein